MDGRRWYRERPESDWKVRVEPALAIIDVATWAKVQHRNADNAKGAGRPALRDYFARPEHESWLRDTYAANERARAVAAKPPDVGKDELRRAIAEALGIEVPPPQVLPVTGRAVEVGADGVEI